jgi:4-amino-4-deoxy-L-arabinose transferase-like glycosyltransferase
MQIPVKYFWFILFILNALLRVASFYTPILDVDETQFAGFAQVLMDGGLPYLNSLDTKPLGVYLFYQFCFTLFGEYNMFAVHAMTALLQFCTAYLLYLCFNLQDEKSTGKWAALFYVVFSTTFFPKYIATSINSVMVVFLALSFYFFLKALKQKTVWHYALAGFAVGAAFLFKYTAGIQWALYLFILAFPLGLFWQNLQRMLIVSFAFALPFILHGLYLYNLGVWDDFALWSLLGSGKYITQGGETISFWQSFVLRFGAYVAATVLLWVLAGKTVWALRCHPGPSDCHPREGGDPGRKFKNWIPAFAGMTQGKQEKCFLWWFLFSLVPVFVGGRFYGHYFIHLLPSLCCLAAVGVSAYAVNCKKWLKVLTLVGIILPATLFWILRFNHASFLEKFPDDDIYVQEQVGLHLKEISHPDEKIFVWGFATGIYFHSKLKPMSRFLWSDLLTGRTPGPAYARVDQDKEGSYSNPEAWQAFWQDVRQKAPDYFIDTSAANIHDYGRFPVQNYPRLAAYLQQNYDKIEAVQGVLIYRLKK